MRVKLWLAALTFVPASAFAEGFDYTYFDAAYVNSDLEANGFDIDGSGIALRGSYAFTKQFQVLGGYSSQEFDGDVDVSTLSLGVGWRHGLNPNLDLTTAAMFVSSELDAGVLEVRDEGFGLEVGLRGSIKQNVELEGALIYTDVTQSDTAFRFGGRYHFTPMFAAGGGVTLNDDGMVWQVGVRAQFGAM